MLGELGINLFRPLVQLLGKRQDADLHGRNSRMEVHDVPDVRLLFGSDILLVVSGAEEGQNDPVGAKRRLDDIGEIALVLDVVEIGQVLSGNRLMAAQVVVRPVCDAPELAPAEGEEILDIGRSLTVEGQFLGVVVPKAHFFFLDPEGLEPVAAEASPVLEPLEVAAGLAEELQLHLLELSGPEGEVSGRDLVPEGLSDLADAEGNLLAACPLYILEVYEDTLCRLGTEIYGILRILGHALEGLEHEVELADVREIVLAAGRAGNVVVVDPLDHLFIGPAVGGSADIDAVFVGKVLNELICPEALMAFLAVHQGVGKAAQVAGSLPGLGIHEDGAVDTHVVGRFRDEFLPPGALYIILELNADGPVIPGVRQPAVNLRARIYKAPVLAELDDFVHCLFHCTSRFL